MADLQETIDLRRRARRRLIGAIALVLALVIVPPWIMDLEPKPVQTKLSVEIPGQDAGRLPPPAKPAGAESKPQDASGKPPEPVKAPDGIRSGEPAKPAAAKPPAPATPPSLDARTVAALGAPKTPAAPADTARPADDKAKAPESASKAEAARKPVETAKAEPARKPLEPAPPAGAAESFVVPLGSYGNVENVKQLQARLAKEGIQSYTEPVKTASGDRTRVRAGPYASREAAEKARERVKGMGIDAGNVIARQ